MNVFICLIYSIPTSSCAAVYVIHVVLGLLRISPLTMQRITTTKHTQPAVAFGGGVDAAEQGDCKHMYGYVFHSMVRM